FHHVPSLTAGVVDTLQINVGKLCNQVCQHCHVDAGPHQTEANMNERTAAALIELIAVLRPRCVDLTGGAPELNPHFRDLVRAARHHGVEEIIDRCNLTVLLLKHQHDLVEFLAEQECHVVASLPAVNEQQTDAQRGDGIFHASIAALQRLNSYGFGCEGSSRQLTLMSNPAGAFMPPPQEATERRFKRLLADNYQVYFTRLIQLTNMPISRFLEWLRQQPGRFDAYMAKLSAAFNPAAVDGLMCKNTLSVSWDGRLFDCDFNQMLDLPVDNSVGQTVFDLQHDKLASRPIVVGKHCLGCTAGAGSSCGGATT
ncbi:MAG: radical SAM/Cys-rich domain protein, partial [Sphaerospermopsis sp. SIO1G2]|nr:radical SAM/Cys-rich domain protein [Sphaerospermopsis sp. SIO1G2]